jgi:hypothetical protein
MTWDILARDPKRPAIPAFILTVALFLAGVVVYILLGSLVNFYFFTGMIPDSTQINLIFRNMMTNIWGIILSSVVGLMLCVLSILVSRSARFISVSLMQIGQIILSGCLFLLSIYLQWKYKPTSSTVRAILPFFITQVSSFVVIEIASLFRLGGGKALDFSTLGAILGSFIGICRSIAQGYFYYGGTDPFTNSTELGTAFAGSILDTLFFFGSCWFTALAICKSKTGGSILWHFAALLLPISLACDFGLYAKLADYTPIINSTAGRYILASCIVLVTNATAVSLCWSLFKNQRNKGLIANQFRLTHQGPLAVNAVVVV